MAQMANLLQARSETLSVFAIGFFKNKYIIGAILFSVGLLFAFLYVPFFQKNLHMAPLDHWDWLIVAEQRSQSSFLKKPAKRKKTSFHLTIRRFSAIIHNWELQYINNKNT